MSVPKSLFRVEFWLREAEGITKPERTEHMVFTRQDMENFAREERARDRQYNVVYYWCRYEDGDKHNRTGEL